jgi:hypothetical protein
MSITEVPSSDSEATPPGVQVLSFDALLDRARGHLINPSASMRPTFHHLVAVRGGRLDCSVDFTDHRLVECDLIWVKPGQILQFGPQLETPQGIVVLFAPGFLDDATGVGGTRRPARWVVGPGALSRAARPYRNAGCRIPQPRRAPCRRPSETASSAFTKSVSTTSAHRPHKCDSIGVEVDAG